MPTTRYHSLRLVASQVFVDQAATCLQAHVYLYEHMDHKWSAQAELYDPDNFPGSPPTCLHMGDLMTSHPVSKASALSWMAQQVVVKLSAHGATHFAPSISPEPPVYTSKLVNRELERLAHESAFWTVIWAALDQNLMLVDKLEADEAGAELARGFVERLDFASGLRANALTYLLSHNALEYQDGPEELLHMLVQDIDAFDRQLPPEVRKYLDAAIRQTRLTTQNAPISFDRKDLLGLLRDNALDASLVGSWGLALPA